MSPPDRRSRPGLDPSAFLEGSLDGLSREELIALLDAQREAGVRISFDGKANARRLARKVRPRVQRSVPKYSAGDQQQQARNVVIEGDNLQALVTLYRERGQVDLIVTDPPYNTGKDFRYNDRWEEDPNDSGIGEFVSEDDAARHTKWMRFMLPRLRMMKAMLKPGGVLAICIDHRELFHLGQMLDELFGDKNRIAIINWQRSTTRRNDKTEGGVSTATEYVLVYARDRAKSETGLELRGDDTHYKNPDNDPEGAWYGVSSSAPGAATHPTMVYAIQSPFTGELHYPSSDPDGSRCWANEKSWLKDQLERWGSKYEERDLADGKRPGLLLKGGADPRTFSDPFADPVVARAAARAENVQEGVLPELFFTKRGRGRPRRKAYLTRIKQGMVPTTFWGEDFYDSPTRLDSTTWSYTESGTSEAGARELNAIIGETHGFETVKPLKLIEKIIQLWCPPDGLVLDPFAGSGTTAHAVLRLNTSNGSERRFVMIEQGRPEKGDSYARTLLAERLSRVLSGAWHKAPTDGLAGGFKFVSLDKKVDADTLLKMERDEMVDTVIASYFDANLRKGQGLVVLDDVPYRYLVARNAENEGFFLIWDGAKANTDFTDEVYAECAQEAEQAGLKPSYHVYARLNLYQTDNVRFYQIPDRILADFGLDIRSEPFAEEVA